MLLPVKTLRIDFVLYSSITLNHVEFAPLSLEIYHYKNTVLNHQKELDEIAWMNCFFLICQCVILSVKTQIVWAAERMKKRQNKQLRFLNMLKYETDQL